MSEKVYNTITTVSLFVIAASAVFSDRLPRFGWLFGGLAVACALVSTWVYFRHGMKRARELNHDDDLLVDGSAETKVVSTGQEHVASPQALETGAAELTREHLSVPEDLGQTIELGDYLNADEMGPTLYLGQHKTHTVQQFNSYVLGAVRVTRQQRTFADEVVDIVRGITALSDSHECEVEFKADGTLKVATGSQPRASADEPRKPAEHFFSTDGKDTLIQ